MHTTRKLVQAITVSLACALPTIGFAADEKHKGEIDVQSYSFGAATKGKTGGANQIKADDTKGAAAKPKPGSGPKPTESMSLNFEKMKSNTQGGPNQVTPPQQPPPQPAGMLVPAVQKVREAAAPTQNTGGAGPGESKSMTYGPAASGYQKQQPAKQMGSSVPRSYDVKEKKK